MSDPADDYGRELWEAYATRNQAVIDFPTLHWDQLDDFTRGTWRMLALVAINKLSSRIIRPASPEPLGEPPAPGFPEALARYLGSLIENFHLSRRYPSRGDNSHHILMVAEKLHARIRGDRRALRELESLVKHRAAKVAGDSGATGASADASFAGTNDLARELWESYAAYNQGEMVFRTLLWDELDDFTRDTWRMLARTSLRHKAKGHD